MGVAGESESQLVEAGVRSYLLAIARRFSQPRVILIAGPGAELGEALVEALPRLPLIAVYNYGRRREIERILHEEGGRDGRALMVIDNRETADVWQDHQLPVFYLSGLEGRLSKLRQRRFRDEALGFFQRFAAERPTFLALGFDEAEEELAELLVSVREYDEDAPLLMIGGEERLHAHIDAAHESGEELLVPFQICASWPELYDWLSSYGHLWLTEDDLHPYVQVGDRRVDLAPMLSDPDTRITDCFRIITTRALEGARGRRSHEELFQAFMQLDESQLMEAPSEDVDEWWAIEAGIPFPRRILDRLWRDLERELRAMSVPPGQPSSLRRSRICWLLSEHGAGTTTQLHLLAERAARAGYPTLVLKQDVPHVRARPIRDFIHELQNEDARLRMKGAKGGGSERPVLIVIDTQHVRTEGVQELPRQLVEIGQKRVLFLWGVKFSGEESLPKFSEKEWRLALRWCARNLTDLKGRRPRVGDVLMQPITLELQKGEVEALRHHAESLRLEGGIDLYEHSLDSYKDLQERSRFIEPVGGAGIERRSGKPSTMPAEDLFWPAFYHFLRHRSGDPIRARREIALSLLAMLAKASEIQLKKLELLFFRIYEVSAYVGILLPVGVLYDWWQAMPEELGSDEATWLDGLERPQEAPLIASDDLSEAIERLREHFRGLNESFPYWSGPRRMGMWKVIGDLNRVGLTRGRVFGGRAFVRADHRSMAKAILAPIEASREKDSERIEIEIQRELRSVRPLLRHLINAQDRIAFCEQVSEHVLVKRSERWRGWRQGMGEHFLEAFEEIPDSIRSQSRVLLHHQAVVLRRSARARGLSGEQKAAKWNLAIELLRRSLRLPWKRGRRDDHPGHIMTTLGLVHRDLARVAGEASEHHASEARRTLRSALLLVPDSRYTRQVLAELLLVDAEKSSVEEDESSKRHTAELVREILYMLSVEQEHPHHRERWFKTRYDAMQLLDNPGGHAYIQSLKKAGVEDGFLLDLELSLARLQELDKDTKVLNEETSRLVRQEVPLLISWIARPGGPSFFRLARRVAELLRLHDPDVVSHEEARDLLTLVESEEELTPSEEYQLACLDMQTGRYRSGRERFRSLRTTGRAGEVIQSRDTFLCRSEAGTEGGREPWLLSGRVLRSGAGSRGVMQLFGGQGESLFKVEFTYKHFSDRPLPPSSQRSVLVRLTPWGPKAVPPRFARAGRR